MLVTVTGKDMSVLQGFGEEIWKKRIKPWVSLREKHLTRRSRKCSCPAVDTCLDQRDTQVMNVWLPEKTIGEKVGIKLGQPTQPVLWRFWISLAVKTKSPGGFEWTDVCFTRTALASPWRTDERVWRVESWGVRAGRWCQAAMGLGGVFWPGGSKGGRCGHFEMDPDTAADSGRDRKRSGRWKGHRGRTGRREEKGSWYPSGLSGRGTIVRKLAWRVNSGALRDHQCMNLV